MRIFVLLSRVPYPLEKGDKLRAYNLIKYLSADNEIILCALNTKKLHKDAIENLKPFCRAIHIINISVFTVFINLLRALFSKKPFQVEYFYSVNAKNEIDDIVNLSKPDHIFCQLIRVAEYVKDQKLPKTLDYQDVFSKGMQRRMNVAPAYFKWVLRLEHKRLLNYEKKIFGYFDNRLIISQTDRDLIPHTEKDKIFIIPNGIDSDHFKSYNLQSDNSDESDKSQFDLVFTGNMGYYPNVTTAIYLVKKILPEVYKFKPDITLLIAGANPHKKVLALRSDNIHVSGWVDDIRECYAKSRMLIAPMQLGTGIQNKLLEAMAMQIPCITSELAANALSLNNNQQVLVGTSAEQYAKCIKLLLDDKTLREKITQNGYNFVKTQFNWQKIVSHLNQIISNTKTNLVNS